MDIKLDEKDREWIHTHYPGLKIDIEAQKITGDIYLNRSYKGCIINTFFSIEVSLVILPNTILPKLYEVSGKIESIAKKLNKSLLDMHVNTHTDSSLCLAIKDREYECFRNGFTIQEFFKNCIENFLFWVSYCGEQGVPPWGEYAHGSLGYLELFSENRVTLTDIKREVGTKELSNYMYHYDYIHDKCLCGQEKNMNKCHPLIYRGLKKVKNNWKFK